MTEGLIGEIGVSPALDSHHETQAFHSVTLGVRLSRACSKPLRKVLLLVSISTGDISSRGHLRPTLPIPTKMSRMNSRFSSIFPSGQRGARASLGLDPAAKLAIFSVEASSRGFADGVERA